MSTEDVQTNLRMPAHLKDRLQEAARIAGRTMTAEVVQRLEASFEAPAGVSQPAADRGDWNRMRMLRDRSNRLAVERANLQRSQDQLVSTVPRDEKGAVTDDDARRQLWAVSSRIYEIEREIHETERAIDQLYDHLSSLAPGSGRSSL